MKLELVIPIIAAGIAFFALCVSIASLLINRRQKKLDNLVTIQNFLHDGELGQARLSIREGDAKPTLKDERVRRVCSSFDFAGALVRNGSVDTALFFDYWGAALLALEKPLAPLMDQDTGGVSIKEYYKHFWWLIEEAKKQSGAGKQA